MKPGRPEPLIAARSDGLLAAVANYVEAARAPNTRRAYAAQWRTFTAWCTANSRESLPADAATLALYLTHRATAGRAVATLGLALAAIRARHREAGHANPSEHPAVERVWEGIRRTHGIAQRRAKPLTADDVCTLVDAMPGGLRGVRDRAMVLLGFTGAFRRSELVALDLDDITFLPRRGLTARVRRSKTDQLAAGVDVAIPFASRGEVCPVRAVRAWITSRGADTGALFRSIDRHGNVGGRLDGRDVARVLKRAADRAGVDATLVSGHSLRAGLATTAALAGKSDRAIMAQGRWRSRAMMDRYVRTADQWRDNPADGLL